MSQRAHQRGEVYWVDLTAAQGSEVGKVRPSVIVSNDIANRVTNRVQIVPLTARTGRVYPGEALVQLRGAPHKAMADQILTATKERVGDYIDRLSPGDLRQVELAIKRQLALL